MSFEVRGGIRELLHSKCSAFLSSAANEAQHLQPHSLTLIASLCTELLMFHWLRARLVHPCRQPLVPQSRRPWAQVDLTIGKTRNYAALVWSQSFDLLTSTPRVSSNFFLIFFSLTVHITHDGCASTTPLRDPAGVRQPDSCTSLTKRQRQLYSHFVAPLASAPALPASAACASLLSLMLLFVACYWQLCSIDILSFYPTQDIRIPQSPPKVP